MAEEDIRNNSHDPNSRRWIGIALLFAGGMLLAERSGIPLPIKFIFNWQVFLIILGIGSGIKNKFHGAGWLIMTMAGAFFYVDDFYPDISIHQYLWPVLMIAVGLFFIFRPRHSNAGKNSWLNFGDKKTQWQQPDKSNVEYGEDYIDVTTVLSGTKKNILSKDFKGGEIVSFLGGTEINLSQADINGRVVMDLTQIFGGTKLIVPPHWDVRAELVSIFAGLEDRRPADAKPIDSNKILVLKGTSIFGGIDIRSY